MGESPFRKFQFISKLLEKSSLNFSGFCIQCEKIESVPFRLIPIFVHLSNFEKFKNPPPHGPISDVSKRLVKHLFLQKPQVRFLRAFQKKTSLTTLLCGDLVEEREIRTFLLVEHTKSVYEHSYKIKLKLNEFLNIVIDD